MNRIGVGRTYSKVGLAPASPYFLMATLGRIDMITKMWRAMPFPSSSDRTPRAGTTIHRIERVHNADRYRIVYTVQQPRAVEISGMDLYHDFGHTMERTARIIHADNSLDTEPPEIEFEASL